MKSISAKGKQHLFSLVALFVLAGCASVDVYDEEGTNTGVRFYTAKPYLMVTRNGSKDKPVDVQVVHLPDISKPQYAKVRFGIGNAEMNLAVANGSLSTFGGKGDSQADEMLAALTTGFKTVEEAMLVRRTDPDVEVEQATQTDIDQVRGDLEDLLQEMPGDIGLLGDLGSTDDAINSVFAMLVPKLAATIDILGQPSLDDVQRNLPGVVAILKEVKEAFAEAVAQGGMAISGNTTSRVQSYMTALARHSAVIDSAIAALSEKPATPPVVELYEVAISPSGVTSLQRIALPTP